MDNFIYRLKDEQGNILKETQYIGDQELLDQLSAFQTKHQIVFGDSMHDLLCDLSNYLINKGAIYV
jgi:hypothetical protein